MIAARGWCRSGGGVTFGAAWIAPLVVLLARPLWCQPADAAWPMFGHDARHTMRSPYVGPQTPELQWRLHLGGAVSTAPTIGYDGTIYLGCEDGAVSAVRPDGTLAWSFQEHGAVSGSPAVGVDGAVYVAAANDHVYALGPDGVLKWKYPTADRVLSPTIGSDGTVYVTSLDGVIYALHADGDLRWGYAAKAGVSAPAAIGTDGTIYAHACSGSSASLCGISAVLPNGALAWERRTGVRSTAAPVVGSNGTIYAGGLHALAPTGTPEWTYDPQGGILHIGIGADGTIYAVSHEDISAVPLSGHAWIYALRRDGSLRWTYDSGGCHSSGLAIAGDGTIYAAVAPGLTADEPWAGTLHAIGRDGQRIWLHETDATTVGPPVIGSNGNLYFGLDTGYLCALGEAQTAIAPQSASAAPLEWALFQNVPNPFNSTTVVGFSLARAGKAEVALYNLAGQRVATLASGWRPPGAYTVTWDGRDDRDVPVASGVYVYELRAGTYSQARRLLVVR